MAWKNTTKHVPEPLRRAVLARDGNQCTALMTDGSRCPMTTNLEADHINRWREGETLTVNMLQTLCRWHHRQKTEAEARAAREAIRKQYAPRKRKHPGLL